LKVVAVIAGVVAVVATGGAALAGAGTFLGASAATLTTIAAVAGVVGLVASFGSQLLTKPPPARGSVNQLMVQVDPPQPYAMGRTYFGGVLRHTAAYGATLSDVPNPYLGRVVVYSGSGPINGFESLQADFAPVSGYFGGFLSTSTQLGLTPQPAALAPFWSGFPEWSAAHKLSGQAAALWNFKFDKAGKVFASGLPNTGAVLTGVKVYDPRADSTYPGGSGAQRINNEATWAYSTNPALHAIAYAYGRHQNGKKVFGIGLPVEAIDLAVMTAWANVCDANEWSISGLVFEPDDRWKNLKDIMAAGGAEPVFSGAVLSVKYHAPRIALDTVTAADLTSEGGSITAMRSYRERINTIVPKWRSEDHNWEYTAGAPIVLTTALADDGEEKKEERQYNLVDNADQSAQLAAYELLERRELGTIELSCGPRLRNYRPGECLNIDLPEEGLSDVQAVILRRVIEPGTMSVRLTLLGETPAKHDYALGRTAVPPPTPSLTQTPEDRDDVAWAAAGAAAAYALALARGKVWTTPAMPSIAESNPGDTWIAADGTFYDRVNEGGILLGGFAVTLGGFRPRIAWTLASNQVLRDALALADVAYTNANDAIDQLIGLADDGLLSRNEKITKLVPEAARLEDKWTSLSAIAASLSVSTTTASAARTAWLAFLAGLSPAWNDTAQDTAVSRSTFDAARDTYDAALYELDRAIKDKAATVATWAGVSGSGKPEDNATRNVVTYSGTTPASPVDGDLWVDTSGAFAVFKLRSGGAWVTGANALSAYNALSGTPVALADINTTESSKLSGIAAGATVGAPTGTPVGSITAGDVSSTINSGGGVASNQVATGAIQGNAVTEANSAFTAAQILCPPSTLTTVQTLTVATTGEPVFVFFNSQFNNSGAYADVGLYLDGSLILDMVCTSALQTFSATFTHTPSAGTHTYAVKVTPNSGVTDRGVSNRSLFLLETKR